VLFRQPDEGQSVHEPPPPDALEMWVLSTSSAAMTSTLFAVVPEPRVTVQEAEEPLQE
jgi:hypothetical protein